MLWSLEQSKADVNKVMEPLIRPYRIKKMLKRVGFIMESEVWGKVARSHIGRLRIIEDQVAETGNSADGVFLDSLRIVKNIRRRDREE